MLKIFERNTGLQVIIILVVAVLLWIQPLAHPEPMPAPDGFAPLYSLIYHIGLSPLVAVILAMLLVLLGGFFLNLIMTNVGLVSQNSLLPTLFYTLFMSAQATTLTPMLLVGVLAISIIKMLMLHSTLLTISSDKIFGIAALIGICSLIYLPSVALLASYLLVVVNYRLYSWRDWMVLLLGLMAPFLPLWAVQYLSDDLAAGFVSMGDTLATTHFHAHPVETLPAIANGILLGTFLISLFTVWRKLGEKTVVWQKNATSVMLLTVAAIAVLLYSGLYPINLQYFAIPFALCATIRFTPETRRRMPRQKQWRRNLYDYLFILIIVSAVLC